VSRRRESRLPPEALEICAADLAREDADVQVLPGTKNARHYKSQIFYIGAQGSTTPLYVVKLDSPPYSPEHEQHALEFAAKLLGEISADSTTGLGVVQPLGWGIDPNFLVTRYQPGELAQTIVDRAVTGWRRPRPLEEAHARAKQMARWLGVFRARAARAEGGLEPSAYLEEIRERAGALKSALSAGDEMDHLLECVESYMNRLADADIARMSRQYPNRGDARPKNFLVGDDSVLYALDMEGFGFGPMEHDISCMHHAFEYDGVRTAAAGRRASALWQSFWDEYAEHGSSEAFALLGYLYFLLERMRKSARLASRSGPRRRVELSVWLRNRRGWLSRLTGDLDADARRMRSEV
jgi:hypothetical protein